MTIEGMNRNLLESARKDVLEINQIDIEIERLMKKKIEIQVSVDEKLGTVKANLEIIRMMKG